MKAVLLPGHGEVRVTDRPQPESGVGDVLVRVRASALCRSDMSLYDAVPLVGSKTPPGQVIPGHELAGDAVSLGGEATDITGGDRVAVYLAIGCGHCAACRRGYLMLCPFAMFGARRTHKVVFVP